MTLLLGKAGAGNANLLSQGPLHRFTTASLLAEIRFIQHRIQFWFEVVLRKDYHGGSGLILRAA